MDGENAQNGLIAGPMPGVKYPLDITYCGECSMPLEYCEYYPNYEKCKEWLKKNLPDMFEAKMKIESDPSQAAASDEEKKRQKRGGKGILKAKKKTEKEKKICLSRAPRCKKKFVTVISGLKTFEIDLKEAAKFFSHKFSCGSSITGDDEIVIQGDVKDELFDLITEHWPEIDEDAIDVLADQSR